MFGKKKKTEEEIKKDWTLKLGQTLVSIVAPQVLPDLQVLKDVNEFDKSEFEEDKHGLMVTNFTENSEVETFMFSKEVIAESDGVLTIEDADISIKYDYRVVDGENAIGITISLPTGELIEEYTKISDKKPKFTSFKPVWGYVFHFMIPFSKDLSQEQEDSE